MKSIKKQALYLQSGRTDNIYEVELLEVGPQSFVVNFRYGRRGTVLKEGTRTTIAVDQAKAEKIFADLVSAQNAKGYSTSFTPQSPALGEDENATHPMHRAILSRLEAGLSAKSDWKLSRAVWRAGEIGLFDAAPILLRLLDNADGMLAYSIVWSLGRLRHRDAQHRLKSILSSTQLSNDVRRIAKAAIFAAQTDEERQADAVQIISTLPAAVQQAVQAENTHHLINALDALRAEESPQLFSVIEPLFFIHTQTSRNGLIHLLNTLPLQAGFFQPIRYIFKAAELLRDEIIYGAIAKRFENSPANFWGWNASYRVSPNPNPWAFGSLTKKHFIKRIWRTLKRLGEIGHPDYTKLAGGVLSAFTDEDAHNKRIGHRFVWSRGQGYQQVETHFDIYSRYITFNYILYSNSPRYRFDGDCFACKPPYKPGESIPDTREEAFPDLWSADPDTLLSLLKQSRCEPVHHFAGRAIRASNAYLQTIPTPDVITLLQSKYDETARLGFELAVERYDTLAPDLPLIVAMADCRIDAARARAHGWIERHISDILSQHDMVVSLIACDYEDTRSRMVKHLKNVSIDETQTKVITGRLFALLMSLPESDNEKAYQICDALLAGFSSTLKSIDESLLNDLMASPLTALHHLAGALAANHSTLASNPPPALLTALIGSTDRRVREMGIQLLGGLPEYQLASNRETLLAMMCHEHADIRDAIRPIVIRIAAGNTMFATQIVQEMVDGLLTPKMPKGAPSFLLKMLREDFSPYLKDILPEKVWLLIKSRSPVAQDLGGTLLANIDATRLTMDQIVTLANHEILSIREAAWEMCKTDLGRVQQEMAMSVRLLDARFEDTRQAAMPIIKAAFDSMTPEPDLLVSLCDSNRPEVQQFGKEMVTHYFKTEHGETYLKKLSEHPSANLQMFATNYLETYATGKLEIISELVPYFQTVLSQVNRGRVAKDRILRFLAVEAHQNREAAALVTQLLGRQSVTMAIEDKAMLIETMSAIKRAYPDIEMPLKKREIEVRRGV